MPAKSTGITVRSNADGSKSYRAEVWDNARGKRLTKTFPTMAAAKSWRVAMQAKVKAGTAGAFDPTTVEQAAWCFLVAAHEGRAKDRGGTAYKPSVLRVWEGSLRNYILPAVGQRKLTELRPVHLQELVDELDSKGLAPATIRNTIIPLRVIYRFAVRYEKAATNPTRELHLPSGGESRDRVASPQEAITLLTALKEDRALWATAIYAGLRRGELMALRAEDVDLKDRWIHVRRSYSPETGTLGSPKSKAGLRKVPIPTVLLEHLMAVRRPEGLLFGRTPEQPFAASTVMQRARATWKAAGLEPIGLHECRHTYASYMIAAGVNIKALSTYMGHAGVQITLDRYGHLLPGAEQEAMGLLDDYLRRAS